MGDPIRLTETQGKAFEAQVNAAQKEKRQRDEPQRSEEGGGGLLASLRKGIAEGREEEKRAGEERRRKRAETRKEEYRQTPPSPTGKLIGRVAARITQHGPPSAAEERVGKLAGKIAHAGAQTIGKAVVVGGTRLIAAGKRGLENAAVNRGMATRTPGGRAVRRPGVGFMDAIGSGMLADDSLIPHPSQGRRMQPPRGPNPMEIGAGLSDDLLMRPQHQPQKKKPRRRGGGGRDIHIHVHEGGGSKKKPRRPPNPEGGFGGGFTLF